MEGIITMHYDFEKNCFIDEMGETIYNIFDYITPNELFIFREEKEDLFIIKPNGGYVEIIFPEDIPY